MSDPELLQQLRRQAEEAVRQAEQRARDYYRLDLPAATLDFSLRGRCAGQAGIACTGRAWLRINLQLLAENRADYLSQTIPHEVAHLVVNWQTRSKKRRPRPHGTEWQTVMERCFGLKASRCHSYRTTVARVVPRPFLYTCNCRQHRLTAIMHQRIAHSVRVFCKACRTTLVFVAKEHTRLNNDQHDG